MIKKMKIITFVETEKDLLKALRMNRDVVWEHFSLDDWDYALVIDGKIKKGSRQLNRLLANNSWQEDMQWYHIPDINKTVGLVYHA